MNPKFPIYVISKGRADSRLTSKALEKMNTPYRIVIEPQEYKQYSAVIAKEKILTLPFSNLGEGSIPARNWVWEHSVKEGHDWHWILDDNIRCFYRCHNNKKTQLANGVCFKVTEDFVLRYTNVALGGLQYKMFMPSRQKYSPIRFNTRIYSCILIRNEIPYRWRGRYNEDTDLSLRALKDGWCTVLMQAFVCDKMATQRMSGGNTDELYRQDDEFDGRLEMAKHLRKQHPDVVQIKRRWGRWHHVVDYKPFTCNRLIKRTDIEIPTGIDNYGMVLKDKSS